MRWRTPKAKTSLPVEELLRTLKFQYMHLEIAGEKHGSSICGQSPFSWGWSSSNWAYMLLTMALSQVPVTLDLYSWQKGFFLYIPCTLWQKSKCCVTDRLFILCRLILVSWMRSGLFSPLLLWMKLSMVDDNAQVNYERMINVGLIAENSWNVPNFSLKLTGKGERGLPALATLSNKPLFMQNSRGWHISHAK